MTSLNCGFHCVLARDPSGEPGDLYIHYHGANLPVKDNVKFARCLEIARRLVVAATGTDLSVEFIGYRTQEVIFDYLAKRLSGVLGHKVEGNYLTYPDLMDAKEYFDCFYRQQKVWFLNLHLRVAQIGLVTLLNGKPLKCEYCGGTHFRLIPKTWWKPPPDKFCESCGLKVSTKDWNYQRGICVFCNSAAHSIKYPSAKKYLRSQFIMSRL
ncbi:hypothetical protein ES703_86378 [subsurface metagenome]